MKGVWLRTERVNCSRNSHSIAQGPGRKGLTAPGSPTGEGEGEGAGEGAGEREAAGEGASVGGEVVLVTGAVVGGGSVGTNCSHIP